MKDKEISYKAKMTVSELGALFKSLLKSMEEGTLVLESGEKFVTLKPAPGIDVAIEATAKKDKEKLEITLSWSTAPCACAPAELKISSKEPVQPVVETPAAEDKAVAPAAASAEDKAAKPAGKGSDAKKN